MEENAKNFVTGMVDLFVAFGLALVLLCVVEAVWKCVRRVVNYVKGRIDG